MRVLILLSAILIFNFSVTKAQDPAPKIKKTGIEFYYSYPDLIARGIDRLFSSTVYRVYNIQKKFTSIHPVGLVYHHKISKSFALGLELNYGRTTLDGNITIPTYDSNFKLVKEDIYNAHAEIQIARVMAQLRWCVPYDVVIGRSVINFYVASSFGYAWHDLNYVTDYPEEIKVNLKAFPPIDGRIAGGFNLSFGKTIYLNLEGGFGAGYIVKGGWGVRF